MTEVTQVVSLNATSVPERIALRLQIDDALKLDIAHYVPTQDELAESIDVVAALANLTPCGPIVLKTPHMGYGLFADRTYKGSLIDTGEVDQLKSQLLANGYPASADPNAIDYPTLLLVLLLFVVAATALYGPQAAALVEMFPTRVRYTAMSLPYHVGTGWVGGFLPVTSFAIVAITGDLYAGLWYPVIFTAISVVVAFFFLKETRGNPLT
jgi:hypothetical protein